jgi:hypothetical protein
MNKITVKGWRKFTDQPQPEAGRGSVFDFAALTLVMRAWR